MRKVLSTSALIAASLLISTLPANAASRCNPRKTACGSTADKTIPSLTIAAPTAGATLSGSALVSGSASDETSLSRVEVQVDADAYSVASGTTSWSYALDTARYADGTHTITARATDASGNARTTSISVEIANAVSAGGMTGTQIVSPVDGTDLVPLGRGRMAEWGSVTALLYTPRLDFRPTLYVRDSSSGASSHVLLPPDQAAGPSWSNATYAFAGGLGNLWVFSGGGPVYARLYSLSGSPLPTSAALVSRTTYGDSDSRAEDMTLLASGGLVAVWHQQGSTGPQGQGVAYRSAAGEWSSIYPIQFAPTKASVQAVAQNPVDGGIWVFIDPDGLGSIAAMRLSETGSGLAIDWTDRGFITVDKDGPYAPDPENPDLQAVADPWTGTVALAYESAQRVIFQSSPFVAGSYPVVTRIAADGSKSYLTMPAYVERVSRLGVVVRPGETWLAYRPVDPVTLRSDEMWVNVHRSDGWGTAVRLGTTAHLATGFAPTRPEFGTRFADGALRIFAS